MNTEQSRGFKIVAVVCRVILGAVFVFSGLIKSIDPWGTALKIGEYLSAFHLDWLSWSAPALAVFQCALELVLGLMLLFGVWRKTASFVTMLFMAFFTVLTLVIAIWNPVDDCGCFGDALKISNWTTFAKNAVLLPMSVVVWLQARGWKSKPGFRKIETILSELFVVAAFWLNIYSWYNLPPVDTFEYRRGTDLRSDVLCSACMERSVKLVYEDTANGEVREFAVTDTTWYDSQRWRYVKTSTPYDNVSDDIQQYDFSIIGDGADIAPDIVYYEGVTYMIMVRDVEKLSDKCRSMIENFIAVLTLGELEHTIFVEGYDGDDYTGGGVVSFAGQEVRRAGMKSQVMERMLRADAGMITVIDGVIADKQPCRKLHKVD